jgi:hypothetical protein
MPGTSQLRPASTPQRQVPPLAQSLLAVQAPPKSEKQLPKSPGCAPRHDRPLQQSASVAHGPAAGAQAQVWVESHEGSSALPPALQHCSLPPRAHDWPTLEQQMPFVQGMPPQQSAELRHMPPTSEQPHVSFGPSQLALQQVGGPGGPGGPWFEHADPAGAQIGLEPPLLAPLVPWTMPPVELPPVPVAPPEETEAVVPPSPLVPGPRPPLDAPLATPVLAPPLLTPPPVSEPLLLAPPPLVPAASPVLDADEGPALELPAVEAAVPPVVLAAPPALDALLDGVPLEVPPSGPV